MLCNSLDGRGVGGGAGNGSRYMYGLEKAPHSSTLAWKIPWTEAKISTWLSAQGHSKAGLCDYIFIGLLAQLSVPGKG